MRRQQRMQEQHQKHVHGKQKFAFKAVAFVLFIAMLIANIVVFAQSVRLSDQLVHLENETRELQKQNAQLQQKVYTSSSLSNLGDLADQLGFTKEAEPVHLDSSEYASLQ